MTESEADEKRLAEVRAIYAHADETDWPTSAIPFLLRLLDAAHEENARLEGVLRAGRNALRDANPAGKTIVDFLSVWLDQAEGRATRAESALAEARERVGIESSDISAACRERPMFQHRCKCCGHVWQSQAALTPKETPDA